ncbi:YkvA family protein [Fictibacillus sp. FJAT-27399]|uniref:YkvA family protein n=1 Tax=Fictibacillus sp. FJAT-27399 TaxID=1729689 RepID=UPI001F34B408|nr:YkvA family protein [Fictibacillus sp. FJAT-27399]
MKELKSFIIKWKQIAKSFKQNIAVLYFAYRNPKTPLPARIVLLIVIAYAFSPIDLIPDFIPVVGYLDDLILLPIGIWFAIRLLPAEVLKDSREKAANHNNTGKPSYWISGVLVIIIWIALACWLFYKVIH